MSISYQSLPLCRIFNNRDMAEEKKGITELKELGEFGLIEQLTKDIKLQHKSTIKGVGDDAATVCTGC